jgi:hypothetical protein
LVVVIANLWSLKVEMNGITTTEKVLANLKPEDFTTPSKQKTCTAEQYKALFSPEKIVGINHDVVKKACTSAEKNTKPKHLKELRRDYMAVMWRV